MSAQRELKDKKVLVVGMARSGQAAAKLLLRHGAQVTIVDKKTSNELGSMVEELEAIGASVKPGHDDADEFKEHDLIVISPGVPINHPLLINAREAGVPIISELELGANFCKGKLVAVTGTNGKTTTVHIIHEILKSTNRPCVLAGNVGLPFCEVAESVPPHGVAVLEVSSFQLEAIDTFAPHVAVILNITPDHLDRYEGMQTYVEAKAAIMKNQQAKDMLILNGEDKYTPLLSNQAPGRVLTFSSQRPPEIEGCWVEKGIIYYRYFGLGQETLMLADELLIPGAHNLENALAAATVALALNIELKVIMGTLKGFRSVTHRLETIGKIGSKTYINDSKATNVDAVAKALESFSRPLILILGGRDKQGAFNLLAPSIEKHVRAVVVMGEAASVIQGQLQVACPVKQVKDMEAAVRAATELAQDKDIILLSPGCSSFDQFENFEKRGEAFCRLVEQLQQEAQIK